MYIYALFGTNFGVLCLYIGVSEATACTRERWTFTAPLPPPWGGRPRKAAWRMMVGGQRASRTCSGWGTPKRAAGSRRTGSKMLTPSSSATGCSTTSEEQWPACGLILSYNIAKWFRGIRRNRECLQVEYIHVCSCKIESRWDEIRSTHLIHPTFVCFVYHQSHVNKLSLPDSFYFLSSDLLGFCVGLKR